MNDSDEPSINFDIIIKNLRDNLGSGLYFVIVTSENGAVIKASINEKEFNKASISLMISQMYELAEDITSEMGIHDPNFNVIHSDNFYILSIKILKQIVILLIEDQIEISKIFTIINEGTAQLK
jgi:predicted regulator of Ras-like GTPase activity (Roadblock/LC7/MglB family)